MWPSGLGFLYQRFSSLVRNEAGQFRNQTKPVSSETKRLVGTDPCACIDPGRLTANPEVIPPDVLSGTRKSACHWRETGVGRNLTGSLLASQLAERNGFSAVG